MVDLTNDPHLIGFWPLNEASGAPYFKNYSQSYGNKPSGISFDLHPQQGIAATTANAISNWPGTTEVTESGSINHRGLQLHGTYQSALATNKYSKYLTIGRGTFGNRTITLTPDVAQSGFTFGIWVLPRSDGYSEYVDGTDNSQKQHGLGNAIFFRGDDDRGIAIGVSGQLAGGLQYNASEFGGPHRLTGYTYVIGPDTSNPSSDATAEILETPIESGAYTHFTCVYRYIDGTNNEIEFYKDGRLEGNGTTNADLVFDPPLSSNNFNDVRWAIGASTQDANANPADRYLLTTGWNHLVSGAYYFNRCLTSAEILEMHQRGGLQVSQGNIGLAASTVDIDDNRILGYYPFSAVGYADASRHHRPLIASSDEGDRTVWGAYAGPFGRGGVYKEAATQQIVATSGLTYAVAESAGGFTIGFRYFQNTLTAYDDNVLFSFGTSDTVLTPSVSDATLGIRVSRGTGDKLFVQVFPLGDDGTETIIYSNDFDQAAQVCGHMAFAYATADNGLALYLDGELQSSGTVDHNLMPHLVHLAGSGFPMMFLGGSTDVDPGTTPSLSQDCMITDISIFNSPLRADEIRGIAQSGIDISPLLRTPHDPRLAGHWPCTDFSGDDVLLQDRAKVWQSEISAPLRFALNDETWTELELLDDEGPWYYRDDFVTKTLPPELASFGNLGITSGVFAVNTQGSRPFTDNVDSKSSIANMPSRWRANPEDADLISAHPYGEYIVMFDVTPSGDIPATLEFLEASPGGDPVGPNSAIFNLGDGDDEFISYLTTIDAEQGSGVSIVFMARETTDREAHVSGVLTYGVPNHVMYHMRWDDPYNAAAIVGNAFLTARLFVNGNHQMSRRMLSNNSKLWPDREAGSVGDIWTLNIGGIAVDQADNSHAAAFDSGLGENYVRNFSILKGSFSPDDVLYFAASGINNTSPLTGFNDGTVSTTQVTTSDADLKGYWRFNGQPSGERDVSNAGNNLVSLAKQAIEAGSFTPGSDTVPAYGLRYLPGPFLNSDLGIRSSGIIYAASPTTNPISPYVASGVDFQDPGNGFSVGLWMVRRGVTGSSDANVVLAYGVLDPDRTEATTQDNAGWAVYVDSVQGVKMAISVDGSLHLSNAPIAGANDGMVVAGPGGSTSAYQSESPFEDFKKGAFQGGSMDGWQHYMWTYDATNNLLSCYQGGVLVDQKVAPGSIQNPQDPTARLMTFMVHQESDTSTPWAFGSAHAAVNQLITDVCYFSRALTAQEVAYIAYNGIDSVPATTTSGVVGGFVHGQDTGSGIIGGYSRGQDDASGIIAGYLTGGNIGSGMIGGYVSGVVFGTGNIGGLILAGSVASGIVGGYLQGSTEASGLMGGFMLGGLQGNFEFDAGFDVSVLAAEDFDAQIEITKTVFSDFDAKVVVFQNEQPPLVGIVIPGSTVTGLAPPFNQYFIGKASGQLGKTITSTRWTFGDLTPSETVSESGAGCYPIQHMYATSGFYIAKFEAIDSDGLHASATRIINAASGIDPVLVTLSGVPRSGDAELIVDFTTNVDILPPGVSVSTQLLQFDDGQTTTAFNPTHSYTQIGTYKPIWCVRDSRGFLWCDSLEAGNDLEEA
jgi:hypothetical protein